LVYPERLRFKRGKIPSGATILDARFFCQAFSSGFSVFGGLTVVGVTYQSPGRRVRGMLNS
jgi:hypothetical protein